MKLERISIERDDTMGYRATEEHKTWLFDLVHGDLKDEDILKGVIKYYVLSGCRINEIVDDIVYRTSYNLDGVKDIKEKVEEVLEEAAGI